MDFEKNLVSNIFAEKIGFIFAYFFFTTTLYLILTLLNKLPLSSLIGFIIKRYLK